MIDEARVLVQVRHARHTGTRQHKGHDLERGEERQKQPPGESRPEILPVIRSSQPQDNQKCNKHVYKYT